MLNGSEIWIKEPNKSLALTKCIVGPCALGDNSAMLINHSTLARHIIGLILDVITVKKNEDIISLYPFKFHYA